MAVCLQLQWATKKDVLEGKAMHVIFGGAFNGKRAYVEQMVQGRNVQWLDAEEDTPCFIAKYRSDRCFWS